VRVVESPVSDLTTEPVSEALPRTAFSRADVVGLVREKRYEEALAVLYRARSDSPGDLEIQRSIGQIKEFLIGAYAKRLGGLDQVAVRIPTSATSSPDALLVDRYIDGTSTFGDIAQVCPLGQLRTLQLLIELSSAEKAAPEPGPVVSFLSAPPAETEDDRRYRELFALGTTAFVQHRYAYAVEAFEACEELRPGDRAASVMLRRSRRDLEGR